ncbi:MAG TPA: MtaA/CmuA family methyltransferase [Thermoleophilia bacterium]|nr:MtaA/CmuA family methyltransferase [Thermoleophilia bacterium]
MAMTSKERVLNLITGKPVDQVPASSGFGNVIVAGLEKYNLRFAHVHLDAQEMADAAAATVELVGIESPIVPFDMGVLAEALGARLNTYPHSEDLLYPTLRDKFVQTADDIVVPADMSSAGRVPLVCEAIQILKKRFGDDYPVGAWVLGPFTLAGQVWDLNDLLKSSAKDPAKVEAILSKLTDALMLEAKAYADAGADFITLREMGATSDVLSPRMFKKTVKSWSEKILASISLPKVYHICGGTDMIVTDMAEVGADAISVDQKNDVAATREKLGPDATIFGNVHPYDVFTAGTPEMVREAVQKAIDAGVDAVWPGCDIWPDTGTENLKIWVDMVHGMKPRRKA